MGAAEMTKDFFAHKASSYEQNKNRVDNVESIARSILSAVELEPAMHLMDFGSGTGLLLERIAPHVGKITAVDISSSNARCSDAQSSLPAQDLVLKTTSPVSISDLRFERMRGQPPDTAWMKGESSCSLECVTVSLVAPSTVSISIVQSE